MTWEPELEELHQREQLAYAMGGAEKVEKHHAQGRLTVRERIELLLDAGTFHETGALAGSATYNDEGQLMEFRPANFVMGAGRINGRKVVVGGDDFTVRGGAADAAVVGKQIYSEQLANSLRLPLVRLNDGTHAHCSASGCMMLMRFCHSNSGDRHMGRGHESYVPR